MTKTTACAIGVLAAVIGAAASAAAQVPDPTAPAPPAVRQENERRYRAIEGAESRRLMESALSFGRARLGDPSIPLRQVHLRQSVPLSAADGARRGFRLTEITDPQKGIFTIYVSSRPDEENFEGQLVHETFHLFNARLKDVYFEGLDVLLTRDFLLGRGRPWSRWEDHFKSGREPLYGGAYSLMKQLAEEVGREALWNIPHYAVGSSRDPDLMEVDIDGWLGSMDARREARARAVIMRRFDAIEQARRLEMPDASFRQPRQD